MRLTALLILALVSTAASAGGVHKCQTAKGKYYYTDKTCSYKNHQKALVHNQNTTEDESNRPSHKHPAEKKPAEKKK